MCQLYSARGWSESDTQMHNAIELRKAKRYRMSAQALFMWAPQDGKPQSGQGVTRDINTFGVYVMSDALPPVGARVQMDISLPKLAATGTGMHLHADGVVLRCDYGDARNSGFAASAQIYPETADTVLSQLKGAGQAV